MSHLQTQFTDSKSTGKNTDQGMGGGTPSRGTTGARGGNISPRDDGTKARGSHLTPESQDVAGPRTGERGGQNRIGHQKHNPAEAKGKAGNHKGQRDPESGRKSGSKQSYA